MNYLIYKFKYLVKRILYWVIITFLIPIKGDKPQGSTGVSMLLCHRDMDLFLFSMKAFFYFLGMELPIYITSDGTLTKSDIAKIKKHFFAKVVSPIESTKRVEKILRNYPHLRKIRFDDRSAVYKYKLDLVLLSEFNQNIILDPDVLFQKSPIEVIEWIKSKSNKIAYTVHDDTFFKKGYYPEFAFRVFMCRYLKTKMSGGFSSGFLLLPKITNEFVKKMDSISKFLDEVYWTKSDNIDEVILSAVISQTKGSIELPKKSYYIMALNEQYSEQKEKEAVMIHYGHVTTPKFYSRALKIFKKTNFFGQKKD